MPIHIRIARSAREIDDALWVRHEVFVVEDGKFGGKPLPGERIVDRFDAFPQVFNVIAYEGDEPIATMRLLRETDCGLPAFQYFDFEPYREAQAATMPRRRANDPPPRPCFGSAGMLAIRRDWRRRRDVIRALFRVAATVCKAHSVSHVVVAVNHETALMYRRLGFTELSEKLWSEEVGNHITPLASSVDAFYNWAFANLPDTPLGPFRDSFDRVVVRAGETIFSEGDAGHAAYVIESGSVRIARRGGGGEQLTLTHLSRGDLFGELALVDNEMRSATATAMTDCEMMALDRATFQESINHHPEKAGTLLKLFAARIRRMDELAVILAFAPLAERLDFGLEAAKRRAVPDLKVPGQAVFHGCAKELALLAAVEEDDAARFLEEQAGLGRVLVESRRIVFLPEADEKVAGGEEDFTLPEEPLSNESGQGNLPQPE